MDVGLESSLTWTQRIFVLIATFLVGGGAVRAYNSWLNRKKPQADVSLSEAQTDKTRAEARKIRVQADTEFSATFERLHTRIYEMQDDASKCHAERDGYKMRMEMQAIELRLRDDQVRKLKGILDGHGIKYSEGDG